MTKKRKIKKRRTKAKDSSLKKVIRFIQNERVQFIFGVLIAFLGIYLFMAIISFFFTGDADTKIVSSQTYKEYINQKPEERVESIQNWTHAAGAYTAEKVVNRGFGVFSLLLSFFIIALGLKQMKVTNFGLAKAILLLSFGLIAGSITEAFVMNLISPESFIEWGGSHGSRIEYLLHNSIGIPGIILLIIFFIIITIVITKKSSVNKIQKTIADNKISFSSDKESQNPKLKTRGQFFKKILKRIKKKKKTEEFINTPNDNETQTVEFSLENVENDASTHEEENISEFEVIVPKNDEIEIDESTEISDSLHTNEIDSNLSIPPELEGLEDYDPKKDLSSFEFPTMGLLRSYNNGNTKVDMAEQQENKDKIINTLRHYGIEITSIKATVGPTITLYEIVPKAGVRISRIRNLEDDIALSLSALGIRIIAPMPGKGTVGIEVPNKEPQIVSMQSVIASTRFKECTYDLPVALGKTITNEVFIFDLAKMPHLLVAGATGQGKSVGLNAIITSLLYKKHPSELKMVLIDPKMVEFNIYSTIERHYLAKLPDHDKAIITDVSKVTQTLNSLTQEMDDRYELLMRAKVRAVKEYNERFIKRRLNPKNGHRYLPYIVVVIDEYGDLIMTAGKEIEMPIARIAQKARAVGIHMVIATQRPTTNIITGTIKANFPARMAFKVTSQIDSRTILDQSGANQLIGRGDMLFSQGSHLTRIQCAFVDTPEVESISQYIGTQRGYESAFELPEVMSSEADSSGDRIDLNERDALFEEAARLIVIHQSGSTSLIQRKFSVGYNRAGRMMDQLEAAGIVGPVQGSKPRDVYIADEYSLEKLLDSLR